MQSNAFFDKIARKKRRRKLVPMTAHCYRKPPGFRAKAVLSMTEKKLA
jgi:hypothetical protein